MNFRIKPSSLVGGRMSRFARACVLCAALSAAWLVAATPVAASDNGEITDPDAPIVICAALICTHPFGLYDYFYFLPVVESAATP